MIGLAILNDCIFGCDRFGDRLHLPGLTKWVEQVELFVEATPYPFEEKKKKQHKTNEAITPKYALSTTLTAN